MHASAPIVREGAARGSRSRGVSVLLPLATKKTRKQKHTHTQIKEQEEEEEDDVDGQGPRRLPEELASAALAGRKKLRLSRFFSGDATPWGGKRGG